MGYNMIMYPSFFPLEGSPMTNIAICSTNSRMLRQLSGLVEDYQRLRPEAEVECRLFPSLDSLEEKLLDREQFPICLLSLPFPPEGQPTPLDRLGELAPGCKVILFVPMAELGSALLPAPFACLELPVSRGILFAALDRAIEALDDVPETSMTVPTAQGLRVVPFQRIILAGYREHRLFFHLEGNTEIWSSSLRPPFKELCAGMLKDPAFVQVAAGRVVNMNFIRGIKGNVMTLEEDVTVVVPRENVARVRRVFNAFRRRGGLPPEAGEEDSPKTSRKLYPRKIMRAARRSRQ